MASKTSARDRESLRGDRNERDEDELLVVTESSLSLLLKVVEWMEKVSDEQSRK
jgi:hypothetical protein